MLSRAYNRNLQPQSAIFLKPFSDQISMELSHSYRALAVSVGDFLLKNRASAQPHVPHPPFVRILHISFVRSSTFSRGSVEKGASAASFRIEIIGEEPETDIPGTEPPPSLRELTLPPPLLVRRYKHPRAVSGTLACPLRRPLLLRFSNSRSPSRNSFSLPLITESSTKHTSVGQKGLPRSRTGR